MNDIGLDSANTGTVLTKEQFDRIFGCLGDLASKLRVSAVFLTDGTGRVIALKKASGFTGDVNVLAALAAGSCSATNEMARMLGEAEPFRMVLHEGNQRNVFVSTVCLDYYLVVIFDSETALGMIRLFTKRAAEQIRPVLLQKPIEAFNLNQVFGGNFETLLGEELDRSFKG